MPNAYRGVSPYFRAKLYMKQAYGLESHVLPKGVTMGKKEHPFLWYYNKNIHFAELINGWMFHGRECLGAEDISEAGQRSLIRKGRSAYQDRFRDLCKNVGGMTFRIL